MPACPLKKPDQRDDPRHEREEQQSPCDAGDPGSDSETNLQVERDLLEVVHQHPALPFAVPGEEVRIVQQLPREERALDLHEECDEGT